MSRSPLFVARTVILLLAVVALILVCSAGPGTRASYWSWQTGIAFVRYGTYAGLAAAVGALILLLALVVPKFRVRPWVPLTALCIGIVAAVPGMLLVSKAKSVPRIHDISTDTADPPAFVALMPARKASPNGMDYGGAAIAAEQQKGYPDIKPLIVKDAPNAAVQRAIDAARSLGWDIAASDAAAGRIEATDTTSWFGFKDDIVIRVRPEGDGSRVDVRSVSRVGLSDLGANAERVRRFLAKLA
jgi:uncharacterized protein (DUF1499 family)